MHETVTIAGPIGRMEGSLEHRTLPNIRIFLGKIDQYTTLEARDLHQSGRRFRTSDVAAVADMDTSSSSTSGSKAFAMASRD